MGIGENIRNLRKKAGFTQKQLAERVGVNEVTIRSYEAGKYNPKMDTLTKLCVALDCKTTDIVDNEYYRMLASENAPRFIGQTINGKIPKFTEPSMSIEEAIAEAEASELERLQNAYKRLNRKGKVKAVERVEELTEIPRYTKPDQPAQK